MAAQLAARAVVAARRRDEGARTRLTHIRKAGPHHSPGSVRLLIEAMTALRDGNTTASVLHARGGESEAGIYVWTQPPCPGGGSTSRQPWRLQAPARRHGVDLKKLFVRHR